MTFIFNIQIQILKRNINFHKGKTHLITTSEKSKAASFVYLFSDVNHSSGLVKLIHTSRLFYLMTQR